MEKLIKKGQSLFEVIVAVGITAVTLVALISLVGSTINNTSFSRDRTLASRHTIDGLEWVRGRRDVDWGNFLNMTSSGGSRTYCISNMPDYPTLPSSGGCGATISGTNFRREMTTRYYPSTNPNAVEVDIVTSWTDSTGFHESRISTVLTDWRTY